MTVFRQIATVIILIGLWLSVYEINKQGFLDHRIQIHAALDKRKSYDGQDHNFTFELNLKVKKSDVFKLNDEMDNIHIEVYKAVIESKAEIKASTLAGLSENLKALLRLKDIRIIDLNIQFHPN